MASFGNASFAKVVSVFFAALCVYGAVVYGRAGDGYAAAGMVLCAVWVSCLAWLYAARGVGSDRASAASTAVRSLAASTDAPGEDGGDRDDSTDASGDAEARPFTRTQKIVLAVMLAGMLAQLVVFYYSPTVEP